MQHRLIDVTSHNCMLVTVIVTSMLVAFSFSSITCFRMTREDLIASFSVIDCKTNQSLIALLMLKQALVLLLLKT